jgi:hypothetical protein
VFERPLRALSIVACLFVLAGWSAFGLDEIRGASQETQADIAGHRAATRADPSPDEERAREKIHSGAREFIDDVNDVLLAPFAWISEGSASKWVRRSVPALIALFVYGFGLGYIARYAHGRP